MSTIVYCHCANTSLVPDDRRARLLDALGQSSVDFEATGDLCGLAAQKDPILKQWAQADSLKIVACYPRAVRWLFHFAGAPLPDATEILNARTLSDEQIVASLTDGSAVGASQNRPTPQLDRAEDWIPWFPVIDRDRCKNCKQCLGFCLFGVYALSEQERVEVVNPAGCKTNCPACARICPHSAIIFPKYTESSINGDEVDDRAGQTDNKRANIKELLKGDLHNLIRQRGKNNSGFARKAARLANRADAADAPGGERAGG